MAREAVCPSSGYRLDIDDETRSRTPRDRHTHYGPELVDQRVDSEYSGQMQRRSDGDRSVEAGIRAAIVRKPSCRLHVGEVDHKSRCPACNSSDDRFEDEERPVDKPRPGRGECSLVDNTEQMVAKLSPCLIGIRQGSWPP